MLTLYNSLTRSLEPFQPIAAPAVGLYSCGPTVYNYPHIGNLRAYVFTDTLSRTLTWNGYAVTHVINITDVGHLTSDADAGDDKMEAAAKAANQDIWAIARHYTDAFTRNLDDLGIVPPTHMPLATDHVAGMIAFAQAIAPAHCYELDDGLYFDVATVPDYGRLAGTAPDEHPDERGARIEAVAGKRNPQDFAIWRKSAPDEHRQMEWDSPWGRGAPGWHLECSVMSKQYLGAQFDIHTGGIDHREIHHPNEIAQNQAHCDCADTGANLWMHNNFLVQRSGKMSKSSGGFLTLQTLVDRGYHPLAYRMLCLQAHYRSELDFSWDNLAAASTRLKRLVQAIATLRDRPEAPSTGSTEGHREQLAAAMADDLNTPRALIALDAMLADKRVSPADRVAALGDFDAVLGLQLATLARTDLRVMPADARITQDEILMRLADRREARATKDFERSDTIRDTLAEAGVEVMDGDPMGWDWKVTS